MMDSDEWTDRSAMRPDGWKHVPATGGGVAPLERGIVLHLEVERPVAPRIAVQVLQGLAGGLFCAVEGGVGRC